MKKFTLKFLLVLFMCVAMITGCSSTDTLISESDTSDTLPPDETESEEIEEKQNMFNGVKLDENGRLIPTAYDMVPTFENGKTPIKEVYVALNGNDVSGDGSKSAPYRTFDKAISVAEPGTSILINPGTYDTLFIAKNLHGTEENPIWIGGIPGEPMPVLSSTSGAVLIERGSYIIIHDMEVTGAEIHGIHVNDGGDLADFEAAHHFVFRNIYNHNVGDSCFKFAGVNYSWLFDCDVSYSHMDGRASAAIDSVGCHYNTVAYNYIHDVTAIGVGFKGGSYEGDIYGNLFVNTGASAINMGQSTGDAFFRPPLEKDYTMYEARDIRTYSNIFVKCENSFAFISSTNCYAVNNTVILPVDHVFRILNNDDSDSKKLANKAAPHDSTIANNIFYYDTTVRDPLNVGGGTEPKTFKFQNNILYFVNNPSEMPWNYANNFTAENTITLDPLLDDNYVLTADSPAIAAGIEGDFPFVTVDFTGKPFSNPRSIGAIEFN